MNLIKVIAVVVCLALTSACSTTGTRVPNQQPSAVVVYDEYAMPSKYYKVKPGTLKIDEFNDIVYFVELETGVQVEVQGSYGFIK